MSVQRKLRNNTRSTHHSPRVSIDSKPQHSVRHSLHLAPGSLAIDRSLNASQATDRSNQSPRVLNSKRLSERRSITNHNNRSMVESIKISDSFLNTSYNSIKFSVKGKKVKPSIKNKKPSFGFSFYKMPN